MHDNTTSNARLKSNSASGAAAACCRGSRCSGVGDTGLQLAAGMLSTWSRGNMPLTCIAHELSHLRAHLPHCALHLLTVPGRQAVDIADLCSRHLHATITTSWDRATP